MKFKLTLLVSLLCFSLESFSFNIDWVKSISPPQFSKGLFCDADSNTYNYGNNFFSYVNDYDWSTADTSGSFLNKYSPAGQLLFSKRWRGISFYIQKIIYDGNVSCYFTGTFSGTLTIDGITITSRGKGDGMIGKMDVNGTILWMTTLGSSKDERAEGICFDGAHTKLLITGNTTDSLFVNNVFVASEQQSTLLATFNFSGVLQAVKLLDFLPIRETEYFGNFGREVNGTSGGNYFLLSDRQGSIWLGGDSIVAPVEGRYLVKLNSSLDTVWTKYISGPACYYGWQADNLRTSASGNPYLTTGCAWHYGGDRALEKFNPSNGMEIWIENHTDGGFNDIFIEGNTIFSAGVEGANYVPGPGMNSGYAIVKKIDQNGIALDSLKMAGYEIELTDITTDGFGNTYVSGYSYNSPMAVIGSDTLYSTINPSSGSYYNNYFLVKLNQNVTTAINNTLHETSMATVLFPNPNQGLINLEFGKLINEGKVCVYGATGNCLMTKTFKSSKNLQIDLSNFSQGIYFIEIVSEEERVVKKVVLE